MKKANLKIEYLDINKLKLYENNAKLHQAEDVNAIKNSKMGKSNRKKS